MVRFRHRIALVGFILFGSPLFVLAVTVGMAFNSFHMDRTPGSHRRSSSVIPSLPEDAHSLEASSTYSLPVSATTSQGVRFSTPIGLGISGCGLEPAFENLSPLPNTVPFSVSPALQNQFVSTGDHYSLPLKVDDFSNTPGFPIYNGLAAAPQDPQSPLSFYGSQAMSASPSYNSSMDVGTGHHTFQEHAPGYWAPTPCSGPTNPLETVPVTMDGTTGGRWNQPYITDPCITVNPSVVPGTESSYPSTTFNGESSSAGLFQHQFNAAQGPSSLRSAAANECVILRQPRKVKKNRTSARKQLEKDNDEGYECSVCGYIFTRRSNCLEHQRRHDPSFRRPFPCEYCGKIFGRKADLKRHGDCVSKSKAFGI